MSTYAAWRFTPLYAAWKTALQRRLAAWVFKPKQQAPSKQGEKQGATTLGTCTTGADR